MTRSFRAAARLVASVAAVLSLATPALAQQREVRIRHLDATYAIRPSGDVDVTEHYVVRFDGEWNGLERILELSAARERGGTRRVSIDVHGATDAAGNGLRVETNRSGGELSIRAYVPGAKDATREVVLSYTIDNPVTFFDDHDELYWNVTGQEWRSTIDSVDVRVAPPPGVDATDVRVLAGAAGSAEERAVARIVNGIATATTTAALPPGSGLTIAVAFPKGAVHEPTGFERLLRLLGVLWPFALPFVALALMWRRWSAHGRDPERLPIAPRYEAPDDLTPGELGVLLDEKPDMRDITATMVDLGVKGHLRIEEIEGKKVLFVTVGKDFRLVRQHRPDAPPLLPHEDELMVALFGGRDSVELSDLKNEFYKDLPGIRDAMMDRLVTRGFYLKRPDRVRILWLGLAAGAGAAGAALGFLTGVPIPLPIALGVLTALPVAIFGLLMPARTMRGARALERALGFREFVERVDGDRLRRMNPEPNAFEKVLPFAMAMGVEKRWAQAFDGIYQEPPNWYVGHPGSVFSTTAFVADLSSMASQASSAMTTAPGGSSGGSGFGGGASVGGGGGGGGGGGF